MKSDRTSEGRGEPSCKIIAGHVPSVSNDKIVMPPFVLEGLESKDNLMKGLIPRDLFPSTLTSLSDSLQGVRDALRIIEMV